jgi:hypothetical protein
MNTAKLFQKLSMLLEDTESADEKHIKKLRKVLQKLKKKQKALQESLENAEGEQGRRKIKHDIEVLKLQRKKGVRVYKALKAGQAEGEVESEGDA